MGLNKGAEGRMHPIGSVIWKTLELKARFGDANCTLCSETSICVLQQEAGNIVEEDCRMMWIWHIPLKGHPICYHQPDAPI